MFQGIALVRGPIFVPAFNRGRVERHVYPLIWDRDRVANVLFVFYRLMNNSRGKWILNRGDYFSVVGLDLCVNITFKHFVVQSFGSLSNRGLYVNVWGHVVAI